MVRPRSRRSLLIAVLAVSAVSCGGGDDDAAPTTTDALPERSELPSGFPADVPLPEFVVLEEAEELVGDTTTIYDVTGWHDGEPVPLGEAYLADLRDAGFEITSRIDTESRIFYVVQGDDWFVSAGFFPDPVREAGTSIGVTVGPASAAPAGG